ncbi:MULTISPECIES: Zn-ribbon domain-containing OB-fold protein [Streptomyces]|uniref:Zinc ribbon domain-containing protein n=2 Tax=Streptomyces TaxID=1883 RepID=A0ABD5JNS0_9ACTN|nr:MULTISPECIES: zinc ribbon domain-containing protein [Streptomyces]MEE4589534.1 zinc ribbon domain-containing protein [Streptomyces sp. DSM 41602]AJZ84700.1 benzoylsuccinyl-CoA thiolase [Streptomyces sp. AgN23]RSS39998.1 benzoylsuccinyl-CoA thiolase [Streptomyces sp. WAC05858]WTA79638.1 zinc ribbon domain-containing protein [Streptomyces antimycoticus]WTB10181.1 zinc ribbon domain-containing protein [Streptomyces antimycoticus]
MSSTQVPVVDGWFSSEGGEFRLLGTGCRGCGAVYFPREDVFCRAPGCAGTELAEVPLSRRGRVWSYTDGRYRPPAPFPSGPEGEWRPYTLIAVELAAERMVVLGQGAPGVTVADLAVGMEVEVVPGVLGEEGGRTLTTWHWRPVAEEAS